MLVFSDVCSVNAKVITGDWEYTSDYYSNRIQKACENFYRYQNVTKAVKTSYYFSSFYVEYMGTKVKYEVPMPKKIFV